MAYEFGSGGRALTLPNPFRAHNFFLSVCALIVGSGAISLLFGVRRGLVAGYLFGIPYTLGLAIVMLSIAVSQIYTVLNQLRFYFGRARPADLTDRSNTANPEYIKDVMRQQGLFFEEPHGPIASALFAAVPNLMYAPQPIRHLAQWQFKTCLTLAVLFLSLVLILFLGDAR